MHFSSVLHIDNLMGFDAKQGRTVHREVASMVNPYDEKRKLTTSEVRNVPVIEYWEGLGWKKEVNAPRVGLLDKETVKRQYASNDAPKKDEGGKSTFLVYISCANMQLQYLVVTASRLAFHTAVCSFNPC